MELPRPHFAKDVPLHHQVYELVRADIMDGLYVGSDDFPGEADLARQFSVSVATSRAVLQRLAAEGLIERGRGRRSEAVFRPGDEKVTPLTANIDLFTFRLLDVAEVIAPWAACRLFGLPAGAILWRCCRLRFVDGQPHSVAFNYHPLDIGRMHDAASLQHVPMPRVLAATGFPTLRIDCIVGVRRPPAPVSAALDVNLWDKLLFTTLTSFSHGDRPTEYARIFFHPSQQHSLETVAGDAAIHKA